MGRDEMERMKLEMEKLVKEQNAKLDELMTRKEKEIQI